MTYLLGTVVWIAFLVSTVTGTGTSAYAGLAAGDSLRGVPGYQDDLQRLEVIAFGSCNRHDQPQPLWDDIMAQKPDLWIWLGDNIYGDTRDMAFLKSKYDAQQARPEYRALLAQCPVIGIWDDHDYGANDAGKPAGRKVGHEVRAVVVIRVVQIKPTIGGQWTAQHAEIEARVRQTVEAWRHRRPAMRPAGQEPVDHIAGWRAGKDEQVFPLPVALTVPIEALVPANVRWYHPRGQFTRHRRAAVAGPLEWLPARPLSRESPPAMDHFPAARARKGSRRSCRTHPATPWPRPRSQHG